MLHPRRPALPQCSHTEIDQVSRAGELDDGVRLRRRGQDRRQPEDGQQTPPHQKARDDAGSYPETGGSAAPRAACVTTAMSGPGTRVSRASTAVAASRAVSMQQV